MDPQAQGPLLLDLPTLFIVSTCVTALLGLFLFFAWIRDRSVGALAWWGTAYLIGGAAVGLWTVEDIFGLPLPAGTPNALLFVACGMIWNGARLFRERKNRPLAMCAGAVVWLAACQTAYFNDLPNGRVVLSSLIIAVYTFLTAAELWRERRNPPFSRWAALLVPALHGAVFLTPIPLTLLLPHQYGASVYANGWFAVFALETLLYAVGTAFIVVLMAKERAEEIHRAAASTDPLTGLLNRRGFLDAADRLIALQTRKNGPVAVLMFDLDRFKSINDRYGHAAGDEALRLFASIVGTNMRANDIVGRLGGEEFAAIIPATAEEAARAAERVRLATQFDRLVIGGHHVPITVSIGVAAATEKADINFLLGRADSALYIAKATGRNRWVADGTTAPAEGLAGASPPSPPQSPASPDSVLTRAA
jgi:diguanylate cyclase (GGDEF)-like protein